MWNFVEMAATSVEEVEGENTRKHQSTSIQESLPPAKRVANEGGTMAATSTVGPPVSSTVDSSSIPEVKPRPRGRPPKPKPTEGEKASSGQETSKLEKPKRGRPPKLKTSEERKAENAPKKRGRPPKPKIPKDTDTATVQTTPKRGRPPKPKPEETSSAPQVDPNHIEGNADVDSSTPKEGIVVPKKRGRPKGATSAKPRLSKDKGERPPSDGTTQKRRPGRPRKRPVDESGANKKQEAEQPQKKQAEQSGVTEKRKPGRPRKQQAGQGVEVVKVKRKPGRPPKQEVTLKQARREQMDQEESEESEESEEESSADEEQEKGVRRKKPRAKKPEPKIYEKENEVHTLLKQCSVPDPGKVCKCLKAGIMNGFVTLLPPSQDPEQKYGLNQVIAKGECQACSAKVKATIKDILYQGDIGTDYETGSQNAKIFCPNKCGGIYVGGLCLGDAYTECGKFYNHCTVCPRFGTCIYDYRETHCRKCNDHYHSTFGMFNCPNCHPTDKDDL